ncbi:uncharacterized protein LOC134532377 [Bacillus rossius redtenbacheri]|uniref:uncharacterized protein LOC134532377 n=1 Tax=Bacillus rossius redtenbacheri TaxID=93214 RepID=UPI002FDDF89D
MWRSPKGLVADLEDQVVLEVDQEVSEGDLVDLEVDLEEDRVVLEVRVASEAVVLEDRVVSEAVVSEAVASEAVASEAVVLEAVVLEAEGLSDKRSIVDMVASLTYLAEA